jgi:undecaprenyl-diphosphatase
MVLIIGLLISLAFLSFFAYIATGVYANESFILDWAIYEWISQFAAPSFTKGVVLVTELGSGKLIIFLGILLSLFLFKKLNRKRESLLLLIAIAGSVLLNEGLKLVFQRSRPELVHLVEAGGYSFPSGHAMNSFVFYGMLGFILWQIFKGIYAKTISLLVCSLLPLAIGLSRIYLGVHFATDVIAGFAAGGFWLMTCFIAYNIGKRNVYLSSSFIK